MAKGNRFSSLPIAEKCARAPGLSSIASDRSAAVSSCFHAKMANDPKWRDMYLRLSPDEQDEMDRMRKPQVIVLEGGAVLDYEQMFREAPLGLSEFCGYLPKGHPDCMTEGTADGYCIIGRTLYLMDIKRSEYTTLDGPRSLQLIGYALAACAKHAGEVDGFVCGIWAAIDGLWTWGDYVALGSDECFELWERVRAAALNVDGDFSRGRHCIGCHGRRYCPAYLMPPKDMAPGLERYFAAPLDDDCAAMDALDIVERAEATCKKLREALKERARRNPICDGEGKMYAPVKCSGRVTFDSKRFEADHPEMARDYMKTGADYEQIRWVNDPAFKKEKRK